jgi:hypothetical protein
MRRTVSLSASENVRSAPGYVPVGNDAGAWENVQFSPSEQLAEVAAVLTRDMQALHVD